MVTTMTPFRTNGDVSSIGPPPRLPPPKMSTTTGSPEQSAGLPEASAHTGVVTFRYRQSSLPCVPPLSPPWMHTGANPLPSRPPVHDARRAPPPPPPTRPH